jgi:DNA-binding HxlR family transcriptional regulator
MDEQRPEQTVGPEDLRAGCPMASLLEMLTRPWTLHILWLLSHNGPMRFGALKRSAEGISARLLTLRLRTLEIEGLVQRTVTPGRITVVTYSPTSRLAEMNEVMQHLQGLSERWRSAEPTELLMQGSGTSGS